MIGKQISHYRIVSYLGGGAMGKVYKAEDTLLKRPVALKFLVPGLTDDADARTRFMQEARAASSLDHPHIGTVHEIAVTEDGTWFIAMAWYHGGTLKQKLESGPLDPYRAESIACQVAQGLSHAHRRGVIHRDIKPANLLFTHGGELKNCRFRAGTPGPWPISARWRREGEMTPPPWMPIAGPCPAIRSTPSP